MLSRGDSTQVPINMSGQHLHAIRKPLGIGIVKDGLPIGEFRVRFAKRSMWAPRHFQVAQKQLFVQAIIVRLVVHVFVSLPEEETRYLVTLTFVSWNIRTYISQYLLNRSEISIILQPCIPRSALVVCLAPARAAISEPRMPNPI